MINIHLQNHLDNYFMNFSKDCKEDFYNNFIKFQISKDHIYKHIDDFSRQKQIKLFFDQKNFGCGQMNNTQTILRLIKLSRDIQKNYNFTIPKFINKINKTVDLDDKTNAKLNGYIFSTKLKLKSNPDNELILYFIRYNLDIITSDTNMKSIHVKNYYAPFILTTNDSISEYGVYENYVLSGAYICKILDYTQQCPEGTPNCSKDYGFIGDIYNDIFPYNEISKVERITTIIRKIEGKNQECHNKYLKYKKKYINLQNKIK
jgi:hypothetical protein